MRRNKLKLGLGVLTVLATPIAVNAVASNDAQAAQGWVKSGNAWYLYNQNGTLAMTSFVSIGTLRHKTISGQYTITPDQIRRRSRKYKNAPMPYSLHVSGGYFIHQGTSTGYPLSHGCIRVP